MNARRIIFLLTVIFLLMFTSLPYSGLKPVYAQDPPPEPPVRCAVIFPVFFHDQACDTRFSVAGDSLSLGSENPRVELFYYNTSGEMVYSRTDSKTVKSANSQWTWMVSEEGENVTSTGFLVVLTNIPYVEAACFVGDLNTGATCDAPAVIDYSITGIDEDGHISRNAAYTPPEDWDTLDPAEGEIDPTLHHTTLVFPYIWYDDDPDLNAGISITNTFDATGVEGRKVTFYLYNSDGALCGHPVEANLGGGDVSGMSTVWLDQLISAMEAGDEFSETGTFSGCLIAHVNVPFAQGYSFLAYSGTNFHAAASAKVDNNIYDFTDDVPQRLIEPESDHTSIVVPFVTNVTEENPNRNFWTVVSVANTVPVGEAVDADFYLYNMDGDFVRNWTSTMGTGGELNGMLLVFFIGSDIVVNGTTVYDELDDDFSGWLLVKVHAPGAEAMLLVGEVNYDAFSMTRADVDNNITGVDGGVIQFDENAPPKDAGDWWSIPCVFANPGQSGWDTAAITVNTRNRSEWQGTNATFTYQGWTAAGAGLDSWTDTATGSHELFPARMQNVSQIPRSGYNPLLGRLRVETNTSCTHGLACFIGTDWIFAERCQIRNVGPWGMEFVHADDFSVTYQLAREELIPRVNITSHEFISDKLKVSFSVTDLLGVINTAAIQVVNSNGVAMDIEVNLTPDAGNPSGGPFVSRFEANYDTSIPPDWFSEGDNWLRVVTINSVEIFGWDKLKVVMQGGEVAVYHEPNNFEVFYATHQPQLYCAQFTLPVPIPILDDEMPVILTAYDSDENVFHQREMVLHKVSDFIYRSAPFYHAACDVVSSPPAIASQVPVLLTPSSPEGGEADKAQIPPDYVKLIERKREVWEIEKEKSHLEEILVRPHYFLNIKGPNGYSETYDDERSYFQPGYSRDGVQQLTFTRGENNVLVVEPQKLRVGVYIQPYDGEDEGPTRNDIKKVRFILTATTNYKGYCTNLDNFGQASDIGPDFVIKDAVGENEPKKITVNVDANRRAFVELQCRDFGGHCEIMIDYFDENNVKLPFGNTYIQYPDQGSCAGGKVSRAWQSSQYAQWTAQYGAPMSKEERSAFENQVGWDGERMDPDGVGPLAKHGSVNVDPYNNPAKNITDKTDFGTGDGFTAFEEYRGFVGACNGTDKYAHRRLSAARKEVLIEIDVMAAKTVPDVATEVQITSISDGDENDRMETLNVGNGTWQQGVLNDLKGLWVNPNTATNPDDNNGQKLLIKQAETNKLIVYQTTNGDLQECTAQGKNLRISAHQPPSQAELTDTLENKGIMAIANELFMNTAGIQIYYIIDEPNAQHMGLGDFDSSDERRDYAELHRQNFRAANKEDYRRFLHVLFVDYWLSGGNPYEVPGEASITRQEGEWKPDPALSDKHYIMLSVSCWRNIGNAAGTYLGDASQREMMATALTHEMGHALRIDGGHTPSPLVSAFRIQSSVDSNNDFLYLVPDRITHPCIFQTKYVFPPPSPPGSLLKWKLWDSWYDTVGAIFAGLPGNPPYAKEWLDQGTASWSSLDLEGFGGSVKPLGGADWTLVEIYDRQWILTEKASPRWAKEMKGFTQSDNWGDYGTPYISVKYHYGAPKR